MAESGTSPEKELLKLIEQAGGGSAPTAPIKKEAAAYKVRQVLTVGGWQGRISFFSEKFKKIFSGGGIPAFEIKSVNKCLGFGVILLITIFVINFFTGLQKTNKILNIPLRLEADSAFALDIKPSILEPLSFYTDKVKTRNLFIMASQQPVIKEEEAKQTKQEEIKQLLTQVKLVGISWSDDPDVILEDLKAQSTVFMKKGQTINEMLIKEVFKDRIVLSYKGEEADLR